MLAQSQMQLQVNRAIERFSIPLIGANAESSEAPGTVRRVNSIISLVSKRGKPRDPFIEKRNSSVLEDQNMPKKTGVRRQQDRQEQSVKEATLISSRRLSPLRTGQRTQELADRWNKKLWMLGSNECSPERDMQRIGAIGNAICQMWNAPISEEVEELPIQYTQN